MFRILIADDHELVRKGVSYLLAARKNFQLCGEAANGQEAVDKALELKPDLIILDLSMPGMGGFEAARHIKAALPGVPIIILTMHNGHGVMMEAQQAGVQGFVTKSETGLVLLKAVDAVLQGETYFPMMEVSGNGSGLA